MVPLLRTQNNLSVREGTEKGRLKRKEDSSKQTKEKKKGIALRLSKTVGGESP